MRLCVILSNIKSKMKFLTLLLSAMIILNFLAIAQNEKFISGLVLEVDGGTPLPGANIYWETEPQKGVVSDIDGNFVIEVGTLPDKLIISYVGFTPSIRIMTVRDLDKPLKFHLKPEELSLEEIIIRDTNPEQHILGTEMGKSVVSMETIKNIPALFGEVDLLRSLQLLPGVQTAGEGTTGFIREGRLSRPKPYSIGWGSCL
jgi:hypothetical protein